MTDPNFSGTVVAVLLHTHEGAFGVVLNRPIDATDLAHVLPTWAERPAPPARLFQGGPVQTNGLLALGRVTVDRTATLPANLVSLDLARLPVDEALDVGSVRIFAGYSGWAPGQLEGEVGAGGWVVAPMQPDDIFAPDPEHLWARILKRQGGQTAWLALHPDDASLN
jgi:putative transcriptional regulator